MGQDCSVLDIVIVLSLNPALAKRHTCPLSGAAVSDESAFDFFSAFAVDWCSGTYLIFLLFFLLALPIFTGTGSKKSKQKKKGTLRQSLRGLKEAIRC